MAKRKTVDLELETVEGVEGIDWFMFEKDGKEVLVKPFEWFGKAANVVTRGQTSLATAYDALSVVIESSDWIVKSSDDFKPEIYDRVRNTLLTCGIFSAADRRLLEMSADEAKAQGAGAMRTPLTRILSKWFGNVRSAIDARHGVKKKSAGKTSEKKTQSSGTSESGGSENAVRNEIGTIQPGADLASYKEALNIMIIATNCHTDKQVQKNAEEFTAAFNAMLKTLKH